MLGSVLSLTLLVTVVKYAFGKYGSHVEEQIFMQHLFALPLFCVGGQWEQIWPRLVRTVTEHDGWRLLAMVWIVCTTIGDRALSAVTASRAPNLLMDQLLTTIKKFLTVMSLAFLAMPP